jgi:hypothetical protein
MALFHLALHGAVFAGGFAAAAIMSAFVAPTVPPEPSPQCVVVNTACFSAGAYHMNDSRQLFKLREDIACHLCNMLNFVWCNEYSGNNRPVFSNYGVPGGFEAHLLAIEHIVAMPGVRSIIYTTGPGAVRCFAANRDTLNVVTALERIRRQYPETEPDVAAFLRCLQDSVGYREASKKYGPPATQLRGHSAKPPVWDWLDRATRSVGQIKKAIVRETALRQCLAAGLSPNMPRGLQVVKLLDECAAHYLDPDHDKPFQLTCRRGDVWKLCGQQQPLTPWANIVAKMCKAKGIQFVIYVPPHLQMTHQEYREVFQPEFLHRIRETFAPFDNVVIVDHSMDRHLNACDITWGPVDLVMVKQGHCSSTVGRLKQSRTLLQSLIAAHVAFDHVSSGRYLGSAWIREQQLPSQSFAIRLLSDPYYAQRVYTRAFLKADYLRQAQSASNGHQQ